jgi:RNA polymerase sigma-70 factor (ECF subfamily)
MAEVARLELRTVIDEELARLPEKCRIPASLCYLEGKTNEQAARELGWPTGSMSRRLEKARRLLRERLAGRGLGVLAGILLIFLAGFAARFLACDHSSGFTTSPIGATACVSKENERFLQSIAEGTGHGAESLAADLLRTAERMEGRTPARNEAEWLRLTRELGRGAEQLASAGEDRAAAQRSAVRLRATCARCHEIFGY